MKKCLKFLVFICILMPWNCLAKQGNFIWKKSYPNCIGVRNYDGSKNKFWYCEYPDTKSNGEKCEDELGVPYAQSYSVISGHNKGGTFVWSTTANAEVTDVTHDVFDKWFFVCCPGGWVEVTDFHRTCPQCGLWRVSDSNIQKQKKVSGGTCTQYYYKNACGGEELDRDCNEPDTCNAGYVKQAGECVTPCPGGQGFKPNTATCMDCPMTMTQGVINGECVVCPQNQFFYTSVDASGTENARCIPKDQWIAIANLAYEKCWLCSSNVDLKKCLLDFTKRPLGATVPAACNIRTATEND